MEDRPVCVDVNNLVKSYNRGKIKALGEVSLQISKGEVFGLIGPNGAGKTTLMQCLLGLLKPTSGEVRINGHLPDNLSVKAISAFLPERPLFDAWMTPNQFLSYHHMLSKQPDKTRKKDVEDALNRVGLDPAARSRRMKKFSRGMLQRVGLAQMLIGKPTLCFLDEPTSGMDPIGMTLVRELLEDWKKEGATIILNSHHLDEVERVCDRVAFIQGGKIRRIYPVKDTSDTTVRMIVKWQHREEFNAREILERMVQAMNVELEGTTDGAARIILPDREMKNALMRNIVQFDFPADEIFTDRRGLEELFKSQQKSEEERRRNSA